MSGPLSTLYAQYERAQHGALPERTAWLQTLSRGADTALVEALRAADAQLVDYEVQLNDLQQRNARLMDELWQAWVH